MQNDTLYNRIMTEVDELIEGGGSGGDHVTITPALSAGTKVADYSINETTGAIYAPAIPSGLATETYVDNAVSGLATETYVDDAIDDVTSGLATTTYVDNKTLNMATTGYVDASVAGLASETYVDNLVTGFASTNYVDNAVTTATRDLASETYVDDSIDDALTGMATQTWTTTQINTSINTALTPYDYVTSSGTEGTYDNIRWRKFNSGRSECWGWLNLGSLNFSASWGNIYFTGAAIDITYPTGLFIDSPTMMGLTVQCGSAIVGVNLQSNNQTKFSIYVWNGKQETKTVYLNWYSMGRWKS